MFDTSSLLDAAKSRQSLPSDYKLAQTLGVAQSQITNYRKGRSRPDDLVARRLAEMAGLDPDVVVVELAADRAQTDEARALWMRVAERLKKGAGTTLALAIFSVGFSATPDAQARALVEAPASTVQASSVFTGYTLSRLRRRALSWLKARFWGPSALAFA